MKFCTKCGAQIQEGVSFCTSCGSAVENTQTTNTAQTINNTVTNNTPVQVQQPNFNGVPAGENLNKGMAVLAYIIPFIVYLVNPKEKFAKYHAAQAMNIWILVVILNLATLFIDNYIPVIVLSALNLVSVFLNVCYFIGLIYAAQGKEKEVPIVGSFRIFKERA